MKTLTATEARKNLSHWLKAAKAGEEIGIIFGADVFALRPVPIEAADYARHEYGADRTQMAAFARRIDTELDRELRQGKPTTFSGKLPKRRAR